MLFESRFRAGVRDGSVTLTCRRWKRRQVVAGRRYRTPVGIVEVDAVDIVDPASITDAERCAPATHRQTRSGAISVAPLTSRSTASAFVTLAARIPATTSPRRPT